MAPTVMTKGSFPGEAIVPRRTDDAAAGFPSGLDGLAQGCLLFALVARQSGCVRINRPLKPGRRPVDDPLKLPPG